MKLDFTGHKESKNQDENTKALLCISKVTLSKYRLTASSLKYQKTE